MHNGGIKMILRGRAIFKGNARGKALVSDKPISFYGGMDPDTGIITEKGHPLEGKSVRGTILVFPTGKGSTVGSYTLYRIKKNGNAPAAIINKECDTIVAVGAIISEIPCIDKVDITAIKDGDLVEIDGEEVKVKE